MSRSCTSAGVQAPQRSSAASPLSPAASPPLSPRAAEAAARRQTLSPKPSLDGPERLPPAEALSNGARDSGQPRCLHCCLLQSSLSNLQAASLDSHVNK